MSAPYPHIAKALAFVSGNPDNASHYNDGLCRRLAALSGAELGALDDRLNLWLWYQRHAMTHAGADVQRDVEKRRAVLLMSRLVEGRLPTDQDVTHDSDTVHEQFLALRQRIELPVAPVPGGRALFYGSFHAFATEAEMQQVLAAVARAQEMVQWAQYAAAARQPVFLKYFPAAARDDAVHVLKRVGETLAAGTTYFLYRGPNARGNTIEYHERGGVGFELVAPYHDEWGFKPGGDVHDMIGLGVSFFEGSKVHLAAAHTKFEDWKSCVTFGGALVHELTHLAAATQDIKVSEKGAFARYGPNDCMVLLRDMPMQTVQNADSYRLLCEDADFAKSTGAQA